MGSPKSLNRKIPHSDATPRNALIDVLDVVFGSMLDEVLNMTSGELIDLAKYVVIGVGPGIVKCFVLCAVISVVTVS